MLRGEPPLPPDTSVNAVGSMPEGFRDWMEANADRIKRGRKIGSLPYFVRDNPGWKEYGGNNNNTNNKSPEENQRIEANRILSKKLKKDPNYKDVVFNPKNGGLKATHKDHAEDSVKRFFDKTLSSTDLEKECQNILYKNGYSCILESEKIFDDKTKRQLPSLDTITNSQRMDIRSITSKGKNTIQNGIKAKRKQLREFNEVFGTRYNTIILYFHDPSMYDESKILKELGETIETILCVFSSGQVKKIVKS